MPLCCGPSCAAISPARPASRLVTITDSPRSASNLAIARPIPVDPPTTSACLLLFSMDILHSSAVQFIGDDGLARSIARGKRRSPRPRDVGGGTFDSARCAGLSGRLSRFGRRAHRHDEDRGLLIRPERPGSLVAYRWKAL